METEVVRKQSVSIHFGTFPRLCFLGLFFFFLVQEGRTEKLFLFILDPILEKQTNDEL